MSFEQAAILLLLAATLAVFALDRLRMEVVALGSLAAGILLGLVDPGQSLSGFSNPAFITVVEVLLIVQVLARSGILDPLARRIPEVGRSETAVLALLCLPAAAISVFMNNIGALALMIPVTTSVARVTGIDERRLLMPVSFAALLGGLCSIIGTPANLIVSQQLGAATGAGFAFFDFAWAGLPAAAAGLAMLLIWPRRVLGRTDASRTARRPPQAMRRVVAEVVVGAGSPLVGSTPAMLDARLHGILRAGANLMFQRPGTTVEAGDLLLVELELPRLEEWLAAGTVELPVRASSGAERREAVIMPQSTLVGSRVGAIEGLESRGIRIVAVAPQTPRIEGSFADLQLSIGDVIYLTGERAAIDEAVDEAEILPLLPAQGDVATDPRWWPVAVFAAGIALAAVNLAPPHLAFGLVVLVLAATGELNLRKGLAELDWPILIMLAAMIPLGFAVETTGTAEMLAKAIISVLPAGNAVALTIAMLTLAVVITPFVNNATTAIVLGPIAVGVAAASGISPEPLLIAVAAGASIDFLTPIGHHNNTVVMGLADYRFVDFIKAGWPVTLAVVVTAAAAIAAFWIPA